MSSSNKSHNILLLLDHISETITRSSNEKPIENKLSIILINNFYDQDENSFFDKKTPPVQGGENKN